jgi:hypothetical protein
VRFKSAADISPSYSKSQNVNFKMLILHFSIGSTQLEKRSAKKSLLECDILNISEIQNRKKKDVPKLDKIYNGLELLRVSRAAF